MDFERGYAAYDVATKTKPFIDFKADLIIALMKTGYDGAWLDTFQPVPYNLCDALGRKVQYYWDFHSRRRYDFDSYTTALQAFLRGVRQKVKQALGKEPFLFQLIHQAPIEATPSLYPCLRLNRRQRKPSQLALNSTATWRTAVRYHR